MSLFRRNKTTIIPEISEPEDKMFEEIEKYKENEKLDEPKDMDFPLPKSEDMYLKIDEFNRLEPIDEKYLSNIFDVISSYRYGEINRFDDLLKTVKEIFEKIFGSYYDLFDFSYKIAKKLEGTKEQMETCYEVLYNKKNAKNLDLDAEVLSAIGRMVSYSYTKIDQYKIKDLAKLKDSISKVLTQKINIHDQFIKWCNTKGKDPQKEKITEYLKKRRKEYDCLPEIIFMVNHFNTIETINIELDKFLSPELTEEEYKYFEIGILNIHWILNSLKNIKFNFSSRQLETLLFNRYTEKINTACNLINEIIKPKEIVFKNYNSFLSKWNFSSNLKINKISNKKEGDEVTQSKTLEIKEKKAIFSAKTFGKAFKKIATLGENIINLAREKAENTTRIDIVKENYNIFEFIIICLFSLNEAKEGINIELIMNDTFNGEFFLLLNEIYKFDWITKEDASEFHILDIFLFNKVLNNIDKLNMEINCMDVVSFNKVLSFLYFSKSLTKLNMSLFSSDFLYIPEFLYKIYSEIYFNKSAEKLKMNFDEDTYLFCEPKDMEDKIIEHLYPNFVSLIATLFEIINKKKKITELGFNIDVPKNIKNRENYMNAIYKFILDIFFYTTKNKITKLCILSPNIQMNTILKPGINEVIKSIDFNTNNKLESLTLQLNFVEFDCIKDFAISNLKILNLGNLDFRTLECLCNTICSYRFNQSSNLQHLSLGLMNSINEFNDDLKHLFKKIFQIKINELESLTLLTNLNLSNKKDYNYLLKLLNYNWIPKYIITFDDKSQEYNTDESMAKIKCIIPNKLLGKLVTKKEIKQIEDIQDKCDLSFWLLKYYFNVKLKKPEPDNIENKYQSKVKLKSNQTLIFEILKYISITKSPELIHIYSLKNK